jgi:hypothetical protein
MFTIKKDEVEYLKTNGLYNYLMKMEERGEISKDDKEYIYQYILANTIINMSTEEHSKFIDGLVEALEDKKAYGC